MEEMGSFWSYQEGIDEMREKLLYATLELESVKQEANQEMVKNRENIRNLLNLLQMAYIERDEAKNQLQKLVMFSHLQAETPPLLLPTKANSSITDQSNSLSESYNPHSLASSPVDSFFDTVVSSPNFADSGFGIPQFNNVNVDPCSMVIDNIVKGKKLPEKGKLLQAVMDAGPLLQTLLVAGPLPRWRNPPPLEPFKIPPVSVPSFKPTPDTVAKPSSSNAAAAGQISYSQMCGTSTSSMMNFSNGPPSGSCFNNALISNPNSSLSSQIQLGKRPRFY